MLKKLFINFFSQKNIFFIIILALTFVAFFVRIIHLDTLPAGLYPDEAVNGIDAITANETDNYQLFYTNNNGREGLFINIQAIIIRIFGESIATLRLASVIFGTLAVAGIYLLALELWHKRNIALISAFLVAFSYWAINFSRIGFRASMMSAILTFSFFFLFRGLRTKSFLSFAIAGFIFGLGFHSYIAFRVAPLILIIILIGATLSYQNFLSQFWKHGLVFITFTLLSCAPIAYEFLTHPEYLSSRSGSISIFSPDVNQGSISGTLAKTFSLSILKYTVIGDMNWRHNYPPYPLLDTITGTLFIAGITSLPFRIFFLLRRRIRFNERNRELMISLFLLGWFFCMLIPEFLTAEGLPHALRAIGTLPVVFLITSIPFLWVNEWARQKEHKIYIRILFLVGGMLAIIATWNLSKYFTFFAENPHARGAFNENYTAMGRYLNTIPSSIHTYVLANAGGTLINNQLPVTAQPIVFLTHNKQKNAPKFLTNELIIQTPAIIIPMRYDNAFFARIHSIFPNATEEAIRFHPHSTDTFTIIHVPTNNQ